MLRDIELSQVPGSYEHEWSSLRPVLWLCQAMQKEVTVSSHAKNCPSVFMPAEWGNFRPGISHRVLLDHTTGQFTSAGSRWKHVDAVYAKEKKSQKIVLFSLHDNKKEQKGRCAECLLQPKVTLRNLSKTMELMWPSQNWNSRINV